MSDPEQISMDDILGDEEPVTETVPEPAAPPAAPSATPAAPAEPAAPVERPISRKQVQRDKEQLAQGRVRDPETGQYTQVETEPGKVDPVKPVVAPQQFTEKERAFLKAAHEERGKRQEWERRIAAGEYVKAGQVQPAAPAAPQEAPRTFWDDPEAAHAKQLDEIGKATVKARMDMAEFVARQKHPDFDENIAQFAQVIQKNPQLYKEWVASSDPAEFAYRLGRNQKEFQGVGNMDEFRAKIERETTARVRAEVETELKAKAATLAKERAAIPGSLSDARSTGVTRPVWGGVPSMDDILKG